MVVATISLSGGKPTGVMESTISPFIRNVASIRKAYYRFVSRLACSVGPHKGQTGASGVIGPVVV